MKAEFAAAGLSDIPVSTSELAFGWQSSGNITAMVDAVDFFMINNFPYFAWDAKDGGSSTSWNDFTKDITYFEGIAQGKPLLVTQVIHRCYAYMTRTESTYIHVVIFRLAGKLHIVANRVGSDRCAGLKGDRRVAGRSGC